MEEGKINLDLQTVDLREVLENVIQRVHLRAKEKEIELMAFFGDNVPFIHGDGVRMEQIFNNLLDNAIRYTEHGSVTIRMKWENQKEVLVSVEDTGKGIPEEELPYLFERFYRVEKSRAREFGGTGLGLAITNQLIDLQGGTIEVSSEEGKGTRFDIRFPTIPANKEGQEGEGQS